MMELTVNVNYDKLQKNKSMFHEGCSSRMCYLIFKQIYFEEGPGPVIPWGEICSQPHRAAARPPTQAPPRRTSLPTRRQHSTLRGSPAPFSAGTAEGTALLGFIL